MTEHKRSQNSVDHRSPTSVASKRQKADPLMSNKERKENFGERITALQQLVSPYGKTDTASVLMGAIDYIRFLHEQVKVLSAPYLVCGSVTRVEKLEQHSLRSRGLCLVPISSTAGLAGTNGADIWAPIKSGSPGI